jgi:hypothetical protein
MSGTPPLDGNYAKPAASIEASDVTVEDPLEEYERQAAHYRRETDRWQGYERWLSHLRLAVFVLALGVGWLAFGSHQIPGVSLGPPVALFAALLLGHDRVIQRRRRADRSLDFFERGIARQQDRWAGFGNRGERHRDPAHPYADDIDVFGEGSLFELICTARTAAGEDVLASWLKMPAFAADVGERQQAVSELTPRLGLRRDLWLLGEDVGAGVSVDALTEWGTREARLGWSGLPWLAAGLTTLSIAAFAALIFSDIGAIPLLVCLVLQAAFAAGLRSRVRPVLAAIEAPSHDLSILAGLLARLEAEPMEAPRLRALQGMLSTDGVPPSRRIAELRRLIDLMDARRNQFFAPIGGLLLWGTQLGLALERWRDTCGASLGEWIEAAAEIEALGCLAGYAYDHPHDVFPEIVEDGPIFAATGLGHPLIPQASCVANDVALGDARRALMMSGSNMSGKSTLLRSVGCATMLGLAGAPVRASRLRLSPLQVAASIQISDSLQQGASHFFAEITRLRQVVDLTEGPLPVLFLLDEILHGTNSHDRKIGADAVVRGLVDRGAIGIVTTHDLALARIADELAPRIENVHFADHIEDGQMCFDYRLRAGVVTKSNAIELMRSVGLDV